MRQPHMVMAVGNHVVGDSRVEKAAQTARRLGYRVTMLGVAHRTVPFFGFLEGGIPVLRLPLLDTHHREVAAETRALAKVERERVAREAGLREASTEGKTYLRGVRGHGKPYDPRSVLSAARAAKRLAVDEMGILKLKVKRWQGVLHDYLEAGGRDTWRCLWPQIVDYEELFFRGFELLQPDLIHVHDRHPMPGAVKYVAEMQRLGLPIRWTYDAHEWLPGQVFSPPERHRQGWLEVERNTIRKAANVLTVSDELAGKIQKRHGLVNRPGVVLNTPRMGAKVDPGVGRTDVRTDIGLASHVPLAVYVGAVAERRGILTMVRAAALNPDLHVAFLAPPTKGRQLIQDLADQLDVSDRVHILDYVPAEAVSGYVKTATVGVSPLLRTAAHETACPTKLYEYLHAGLPIVVSDMRVQARFVRDHGVGEVFPADNAFALMRAIQCICDDPMRYRRRISERLREDLSWQTGEPVMAQAWSQLTPLVATPEVARVRDVKKVTVLAPEVAELAGDLEQQGRVVRVIDSTLKDVTSLTELEFPYTRQGRRFSAFLANSFAGVSEFIYDSDSPVISSLPPGQLCSVLDASGVACRRYVGHRNYDDVDVLLDLYPHHWLRDLDLEALDRLRRQARRGRASLARTANSYLCANVGTALSFGSNAIGMLPPFQFTARHDKIRFPRTVAVLPVRRSRAEMEQLDCLLQKHPRMRVYHLADDIQMPDVPPADVYIDSLTEDHPGALGMRVLARGKSVLCGVGGGSTAMGEVARSAPIMRVPLHLAHDPHAWQYVGSNAIGS